MRFRFICCFICEENLPMLLMDKLPLFIQKVYSDSRIASSLFMNRGKATQIITGILGPTFKKEVLNDLKSSKFSIIIDETTDISVKKSLVIIGGYWSPTKNCGVDHILDLVEVTDCTAEQLFQTVKGLLDCNFIPYENMIGFGRDNASVMMGSVNGVQAKLRQIVPNIHVQGCTCHSLHLCASAAASKLPNVVEQFVRDIYAYFSHSSKRLEELRECQIFANEKPHKVLYPSQTRCLSLKVSLVK